MKLLRTAAVLLLLVQTFQLGSLQNSTDSPGRTIDKSWWRKLPKENLGVPTEESENADGGDAADYSGIASGSMAVNSEEEQNLTGRDTNANGTSDDSSFVTTAAPHVFHGGHKKKNKHPKPSVHPKSTNSSHSNATEAEFDSPQNSTGFPDVQPRTSAPKVSTARNSTTEAAGEGLDNSTGSSNATAASTPETNRTSTTNSSATEVPLETSEMSPTTADVNATANATTATPEVNTTTANTTTATPEVPANTTTATPDIPANATTAAAPTKTDKSNGTDKSGGSGGGSKRGLASDPGRSSRQGAWAAVLGTAAAVALVGLVAFVILRKKQQKAFSHRKLVEDFPADPVLRLDNNEPLDLNFGGSAYYNPGLQGDNIQMSSIPGRP
ncbi:cell wall protein IFF6 [Stegastes partitus]|uniref:Mucin 15, cell surface associated n=1 Tax=Stegastes partitus TaxID=144197 RepID=A0A3B4Z898_9TELE|nr:PREDICTED: mucin-15 [Stegastes partitus]